MIIKTILLICFAAFFVGAAVANDDGDDFQRTIRVTGEGKASAVPDMATIYTGVVTQSKLAVEATEQNNQIVKKLMEDLQRMEVAEKDVQTSQFDVRPEYQRGPRGQQQPQIIGYRVSNQLQIRVRNLPKLGELLDTLIHSGSNQVSGISFGVDDTTDVMNEARVKAMADAQARAGLFAKAAGVAVGKVLSISEQQVVIPQPAFYARSMESGGASSVPMASGQQDFTASIFVTFQIVDQK